MTAPLLPTFFNWSFLVTDSKKRLKTVLVYTYQVSVEAPPFLILFLYNDIPVTEIGVEERLGTGF